MLFCFMRFAYWPSHAHMRSFSKCRSVICSFFLVSAQLLLWLRLSMWVRVFCDFNVLCHTLLWFIWVVWCKSTVCFNISSLVFEGNIINLLKAILVISFVFSTFYQNTTTLQHINVCLLIKKYSISMNQSLMLLLGKQAKIETHIYVKILHITWNTCAKHVFMNYLYCSLNIK